MISCTFKNNKNELCCLNKPSLQKQFFFANISWIKKNLFRRLITSNFPLLVWIRQISLQPAFSISASRRLSNIFTSLYIFDCLFWGRFCNTVQWNIETVAFHTAFNAKFLTCWQDQLESKFLGHLEIVLVMGRESWQYFVN